jgi:alkanesulfonate monooxygenase SsuD/methylene tetrahydromethanopterin reductase-like flavin-dependent oxidoreductase (luciferase family)
MKIGVLFPPRFEDPGEFLADARAIEAAGVDSVWLEERSDDLDPTLLLAAIAAVTSELRLGLIQETPFPSLALRGGGPPL